jgi:hypothetical protein
MNLSHLPACTTGWLHDAEQIDKTGQFRIRLNFGPLSNETSLGILRECGWRRTKSTGASSFMFGTTFDLPSTMHHHKQAILKIHFP